VTELIESYQLLEKPLLSPRVQNLKETLLAEKPTLCTERLYYYTKSYQETEGLPVVKRRAKALAKYLDNMTIFVRDDELIVGRLTEHPRGTGPLEPILSLSWLMRELDDPVKGPAVRKQDQVVVSNRDRQILKEEVFPYWQGKLLEDYVRQHLPDETMEKALPCAAVHRARAYLGLAQVCARCTPLS
jgi:formate C-acetyltransferase